VLDCAQNDISMIEHSATNSNIADNKELAEALSGMLDGNVGESQDSNRLFTKEQVKNLKTRGVLNKQTHKVQGHSAEASGKISKS